MKKILSALAICLVLALCVGLAIADSDTGYDGREFEWPTRTHDGIEEERDPDRSTDPTCTTNGVSFYKCAWDESLFHEVVAYALGHTYEAPGFDWNDPNNYRLVDCYHREYTCGRCGEKLIVDVADHLWSSDIPGQEDSWGKIIEEPTCTSEGKAIDFCTRCGLEGDKVRIIEKKPHIMEPQIDTWPYCTTIYDDEHIEDGTYYLACKNCGEPVADEDGIVDLFDMDLDEFHNMFGHWDYDGHDWDGMITTKEANCQTEGEGVRFCRRCGSKQITVIPTTPHNYVEKKILQNCYEADFSMTCVNIIDGVECGWEDPTYDGGIKPFLSHEFGTVADAELSKDPTCTEPGYLVYRCIHFDEDDLMDYEFDTSGHQELDADDIEFAPEAVLKFAGYKKVDVPALGHDWGEWVLRYEIGEGENDYAYYVRTCKRDGCGATEEKVTLFAPEECAEGEHEWEAVGFDLATCEEPGMVWYKCFKCGAEDAEETPATGHDFEEELVKAATCTEPGKILKTCKVCDYIETEEIEAEGHKWVDQGDGTEKCSVCGEVKGDAWKEGFVVEDGVWKWYVHDVWQENLTDIVKFDGAEFWVVKGVLPLDANGLINCPDGKFYFLSQGKIVRNTGFVEYLGQWFKIVNGELDLTYNGLCDYDGGKFLVAAGRWIQTVSGLWQNLDSKWYYLADGQVVAYSGVAEYNGRFFVVENGVLDTSYNGTIKYDGHTFEVVNGQLAEVPID